MSYNDKLNELQEQRNKLSVEIRELADIGQSEEGFNAEQRSKWETVNSEYESTVDEMGKIQDKVDIAARAAALEEKQDRQASEWKTEVGQARQERAGETTEEHRALALQAWLRTQNDIEIDKRHEDAAQRCGVDLNRAKWKVQLRDKHAQNGVQAWESRGGMLEPKIEHRALSVGTDSAGGYTVPEGFSNELERSMLAFGGPRRVARIVSTDSGNDLPWPTVDDTSNKGAILGEGGSIGASTDPSFGVITFKAYKYSSKPVLVSQELLEDSAFNMASVIASLLGERIGRAGAEHFTTGDNSSKPQGITVGAGAGVTAAGAAAVTADELISLQDALDPAYESFPSVGWMMKKSTITAIRKLKDSDGQYLWQPGLTAGQPDLLLGKPYTVNQDMPAMATGNVSIVYGAMEKYVIRDVTSARFYRLEERYRDNDQTGFILFSRHDGRLLDAGTNPVIKLTQA